MHLLNNLNKFSDLWKVKGQLFKFAIFLLIFIDLMRNQNFSTLPSGVFPLCHSPKQKNKNGYKYMCQSCMHDGSRPSIMSHNYIYCQKLPRFSCVLTAFCLPSSCENEICTNSQVSYLLQKCQYPQTMA